MNRFEKNNGEGGHRKIKNQFVFGNKSFSYI